MKHPPERPLVITVDTREPAVESGDHPDSVFRPRILAPGCPRGTPSAIRPRVEVPVVRAKLDVGDYSLPGLEHVVALERKSLRDLLGTLFGEAGVDSLGEARHNIDRFRVELERAYAARLQLFAIVVEGDPHGIRREARQRVERYGKSFDPDAVFSLLESFAVDLACPTLWCSPVLSEPEPVWMCPYVPGEPPDVTKLVRGWSMPRILMTSKEVAELRVGWILARVLSQATGGEKSRDAAKRGYAMPWLGALAEVATQEGAA